MSIKISLKQNINEKLIENYAVFSNDSFKINALSKILINKYSKSIENTIIEVLVENKTKESTKFFGRSEYMTSVIFNGTNEDVGKIVKVKINKSNQNTLFGEKVRKSKLRVA